MEKQQYELSVWEDYRESSSKTFKERKVAIISSDDMDNPLKAYNVTLKKKITGEKELTFSILARYTNEEGERVANPYFNILNNETKLKLRDGAPYAVDDVINSNTDLIARMKEEDIERKWKDFIIKKIDLDSTNYVANVTAREIYVNELGKNGWSLLLDTELMNNTGTLAELGERVLEGTDWKFDPESTYVVEAHQQPLFKINISKDTKISRLLKSSAKTVKGVAYAFYDDVEWNADAAAWRVKSDLTSLQVLYIDGKEIDNTVIDDNNLIIDDDYNYNYSFKIDKNIKGCEMTNYQGKKMIKSQRSIVEPISGKVVKVYTAKKDQAANGVAIGDTIYGYKDAQYIGPTVLQNWIANSSLFTQTSGWRKQVFIPVGHPDKFNSGTVYYVYNGNSFYSKTTDNTPNPDTYYYTATNAEITQDLINMWPTYSENRSTYFEYLRLYFNDKYTKNNTEYVTKHTAYYNIGPYTQGKELVAGQRYVIRIKGRWIEHGNNGYSSTSTPPHMPKNSVNSTDATPQNMKLNCSLIYKKKSQMWTEAARATTIFTFTNSDAAFNNAISAQDFGGGAAVDTSNKYTTCGYYNKTAAVNRPKYNNEVTGAVAKPHVDEQGYIFGYVTASVSTTMKYQDVAFKIWTNNTANADYDYCIEDVQFFPYELDANDKPVFIGDTPEAVTRMNNVFYYVDDNDTMIVTNKGTSYYSPVYSATSNGYESCRTLSIKESNYFNALQNLAEVFEVWVDFYIKHQKDGQLLYDEHGLPQKYVKFSRFAPNSTENHLGFKYGINLKGIKRSDDSDTITSKLIVKDNSNEHADNGFCTIARAQSSPHGEREIYNFDYYISKEFIPLNTLNVDLYGVAAGDMRYYPRLKELNAAIIQQENDLEDVDYAITKLEKEIEAYVTGIQEREDEIADMDYNIENYQDPDKQKVYKQTRARLVNERKVWEKWLTTANKNLTKQRNKRASLNKQLNGSKGTLTQKKKLKQQFYAKYSRFIQEGTWTDNNYIDDELYYLDAMKVAAVSAYPKVSYTINVVDLAGTEDYWMYKFEVGQKTWIEDPEFFGYSYKNSAGVIVEEGGIKTPNQKEVVIAEISKNFNDRSKTVITIKTYKNQYEELFQKLQATSQSLQFNEGDYQRAAQAVQPNQTIKVDILQNTFQDSFIELMATQNDEVSINTGEGITVRSKDNPDNIVRIISGGVWISNNGSENLHKVIDGNGIYTQYLRAGQIDAALINIVSGDQYVFAWDETGLAAKRTYMDTANKLAVDPNKYVKFNQYGLYAIDGRQAIEKYTVASHAPENNENYNGTWEVATSIAEFLDQHKKTFAEFIKLNNAIQVLNQSLSFSRQITVGNFITYVNSNAGNLNYKKQTRSSNEFTLNDFNTLNGTSYTLDTILDANRDYRFTDQPTIYDTLTAADEIEIQIYNDTVESYIRRTDKSTDQKIDYIQNNSPFSLTWDGLQLGGSGSWAEDVIKITTYAGLEIFGSDKNDNPYQFTSAFINSDYPKKYNPKGNLYIAGNRIPLVSLGRFYDEGSTTEDRFYGLRMRNADGYVTISTDYTGRVWSKDTLFVGTAENDSVGLNGVKLYEETAVKQTAVENILSNIGIILPDISDSPDDETIYAFNEYSVRMWAGDGVNSYTNANFIVFKNGMVFARNGYFAGSINAENGLFSGNVYIGENGKSGINGGVQRETYTITETITVGEFCSDHDITIAQFNKWNRTDFLSSDNLPLNTTYIIDEPQVIIWGNRNTNVSVYEQNKYYIQQTDLDDTIYYILCNYLNVHNDLTYYQPVSLPDTSFEEGGLYYIHVNNSNPSKYILYTGNTWNENLVIFESVEMLTIDKYQFAVLDDGQLYAQDVNIRGEINIETGTLREIHLGQYSGLSSITDYPAIWINALNEILTTAQFYVTQTGTVYAQDIYLRGMVGSGEQIVYMPTNDTIFNADKQYYVYDSDNHEYDLFTGNSFVSGTTYYERLVYYNYGINSDEYAFWSGIDEDSIELVGDNWIYNVPNFRVDKQGNLFASNVDLGSGTLVASNVNLDGILKVGDITLTSDDGGRIENGLMWYIDGKGNAEFNNARIRGELSTVVFKKETVAAVGGSLLISPSQILQFPLYTDGQDPNYGYGYILPRSGQESFGIEWNTVTKLYISWTNSEGGITEFQDIPLLHTAEYFKTFDDEKQTGKTYYIYNEQTEEYEEFEGENFEEGVFYYEYDSGTRRFYIDALSIPAGASIISIDENTSSIKLASSQVVGDENYGPQIIMRGSNSNSEVVYIGNLRKQLAGTAFENISEDARGSGIYTNNAYLEGRLYLPQAGVTNEDTEYEGSAIRFWAGAAPEHKDEAPFIVTQDGNLYATKGIFSGEVRATNSTFSGWLRVAGILIEDDDDIDDAALTNEFYVAYDNENTPGFPTIDDYIVRINKDGLSIWEGGLRVFSDYASGWREDGKTGTLSLPYGTGNSEIASYQNPFPYIAAIDDENFRLYSKTLHIGDFTKTDNPTDSYGYYGFKLNNGVLSFLYSTLSNYEDGGKTFNTVEEQGFNSTAYWNMSLSTESSHDLRISYINVTNVAAYFNVVENKPALNVNNLLDVKDTAIVEKVLKVGSTMRVVPAFDSNDKDIGLDFII